VIVIELAARTGILSFLTVRPSALGKPHLTSGDAPTPAPTDQSPSSSPSSSPAVVAPGCEVG
jgi:hypothetical protein